MLNTKKRNKNLDFLQIHDVGLHGVNLNPAKTYRKPIFWRIWWGHIDASYEDTGLTINITPKFQNSVFIIHSSQNFYVTEEPGTDAQVQFVIQRVISGGSTTQIKEAVVGDHTGSGNRSTTWGENNFTVYDLPNTTSQLTYKTQYKVYNSGWTAGVQTSSQCSHIIVHEVKQWRLNYAIK